MPTFGKDTIRRFPGNVSDMKRIAVHDFEDLLQVCAHHPISTGNSTGMLT